MSYFVYVITNMRNTTFYIGVTNNLERRMYEHKNKLIGGFSKKYKLKKLIHFEEYPKALEAIRREKQLKNWRRDWKLNLIKQNNPRLNDLLDPELNSG
ncbi:GIY-YIG nuclease family protein [Patescibacteria group bacterium]|nr:GIY-YIG nuclease family protein [Patescibacteria group bacterium]